MSWHDEAMKLIIHSGLHKTGSTYLQHALNMNHDALAQRGVWYEPQPGYPAHHAAAWKVLEGDPQPIAGMIEQARQGDCHTVLVSSEDLEGALYDQRPLCAVKRAADASGVSEIEWHIVLREPGPAFASLFAQLQHHVYADAFQLFYDVMRRGFIHMEAPMPGSGTPYWYYSFDHLKDLTQLQERTGARVIAHDFAAQATFPGAGILDGLDAMDAIAERPGPQARNARATREQVIEGNVARVAEAVPDALAQERIVEVFLACLENSLDSLSTYSELVGERFRKSHLAALERFGLPSRCAKP